MKRKLLALLVAFTVVFSFAACGKKTEPTKNDKDIDTVTEPADKGAQTKPGDKAPADDSAKKESGSQNPAADQGEFNQLMEGYEKAKEEGDEKAEREYLDKIQAILESVESESADDGQ